MSVRITAAKQSQDPKIFDRAPAFSHLCNRIVTRSKLKEQSEGFARVHSRFRRYTYAFPSSERSEYFKQPEEGTLRWNIRIAACTGSQDPKILTAQRHPRITAFQATRNQKYKEQKRDDCTISVALLHIYAHSHLRKERSRSRPNAFPQFLSRKTLHWPRVVLYASLQTNIARLLWNEQREGSASTLSHHCSLGYALPSSQDSKVLNPGKKGSCKKRIALL